MKVKKKDFDIFNLSFLDIITCGFGAIVLLVLISHTDRDTPKLNVEQTEDQLNQVLALKTQVNSLARKIDQRKKLNEIQLENSRSLGREVQASLENLRARENEEKELVGDLDGLSLVQSTLKKASISPSTSNTVRDEEVGGIPVDSDYVIFVVDTSGSMRAIWDRVTQQIINILTIHPQVKGFQILDDQGKAILAGYSGQWIPDVPFRRKSLPCILTGHSPKSLSYERP